MKCGRPAGVPTTAPYTTTHLLAKLSAPRPLRPRLVVGFAAETESVIAHATSKRQRKQCDWIVANDVSPQTGIMGGLDNQVALITADGAELWPRMSKADVAKRLVARITLWLSA